MHNDSNAAIQTRLKLLLKENPDLQPFFKEVRKLARTLRKPAVYDVTSKCNLLCEGCYYFEGDKHSLTDATADEWLNLMQRSKEEKISFGYFAGAEPALAQEKLLTASKFIPHGTLASNGTIKINKEINYRIIVSIWGSIETTSKLRGGNTFWKAIHNYTNDTRALFAYTVTRKNIGDIRSVASILEDHNIQLSFNMYNPTESYSEKININKENDKKFFRISSKDDNLVFSNDDLRKTRDIISTLTEQYPKTIVYPQAYNKEVTSHKPLFEIDEEGLATNCAGRHNGTHRTYLSNAELSSEKCCTPNIACNTCRQLTSYLPSRLRPKASDVLSRASLIDWLEICEFWAWFYLGAEHQPKIRSQLCSG